MKDKINSITKKIKKGAKNSKTKKKKEKNKIFTKTIKVKLKKINFEIKIIYIIIAIVICLLIISYFMFSGRSKNPLKKNNDEVTVHDDLTNYTTIQNISDSLNISQLMTNYSEKNEEISSSIDGDKIVFEWKKGNANKKYYAELKEDDLVFEINKDDKINMDIFRETAYVICVYYTGNTKDCRYSADRLDETKENSAIKYEKKGNTIIAYLTTLKGIDASSEE